MIFSGISEFGKSAPSRTSKITLPGIRYFKDKARDLNLPLRRGLESADKVVFSVFRIVFIIEQKSASRAGRSDISEFHASCRIAELSQTTLTACDPY